MLLMREGHGMLEYVKCFFLWTPQNDRYLCIIQDIHCIFLPTPPIRAAMYGASFAVSGKIPAILHQMPPFYSLFSNYV